MHVSFRRSTIAAAALLLTTAASMHGQERVDPIPDAPEQIVEALSPFSDPPDSSRVAKLLAQEAARSDFPATDHDRVLLARLWRLAGETELALESLRTIAETSETAPLATYEVARIQLEAGRADAGSRAYDAACAAADEAVRTEIAWDLLPVTTPEEREAWTSIGDGSALCDWLRDFWDERALRSAMQPDERIGLHFQRLAEARSAYRLKRPRTLNGMADSFGRPAGLPVDDRGLLLIRMGAPQDDLACPEEVSPSTDPRNLVGRCWVYWRPEGYRIFYLSTRDRFQGDWPSGDYRIQESLSQQAEPGGEFFQKYVMNADIPERLKQNLVRRGSVSREAKLAEGYKEIPGILELVTTKDELQAGLDASEESTIARRLRLATRDQTAAVLEQIPDAPDVESTVALRFEALRFLNPAPGTWQVWLLNSVRAGDLARSSSNSDATLDAAGRFLALKDEGLSMQELASLKVPAASIPDAAGLALRGVLEASPGTLPLTVVIEDLNAPGTGAWHHDTISVPALGGLPQLSDIAVAQAEGGTWTRDGETFLQVSPAHITNPDGSIHTYFEVYGVRPGTRYEVEVRLTETDVADRIWRLEPDGLGFRLQFTSEMTGDIGSHHLRLDLSGTEPGEYVLAVRIQDEDSGAYSLPTVTDVFVASD